MPKRSPKDLMCCYGTRGYVFSKSILFRNDVKHTSLAKNGFSRLGRRVYDHLFVLPGRAIICPKRKTPAAVNVRGTRGPFFQWLFHVQEVCTGQLCGPFRRLGGWLA